MELIFKEVTLRRSTDQVNLYFLGDFHRGHINHDYDKLEKHIKLIKNDKDAYVIGMGDNCDNRSPDHKHYDVEQIDPKIIPKSYIYHCYRDFEKSIVAPIQDKWLCLLEGNHDKGKKFGHPYTRDICERFGIPFGGYRAFIYLNIKYVGHTGNYAYIIFVHHGFGGGRKKGSKIDKVIGMSEGINADIIAGGHTHILDWSPEPVHSVYRYGKVLQLKEEVRHHISTGTYLKSYQEGNYSYTEKFGFKPTLTGCVKLSIWPRKREALGRKLI